MRVQIVGLLQENASKQQFLKLGNSSKMASYFHTYLASHFVSNASVTEFLSVHNHVLSYFSKSGLGHQTVEEDTIG